MSNLWQSFEKNAGKYCCFVPLHNFDYSVNISLKYNYLYTETPKNGCSTIKSILQRLEINDPEFCRKDLEDIHNRNFSPLLKPSQVGDLDRFIADQKPFKFCISRNPYSRLLSAYLDKISSNCPQKRSILLHLGKDASRPDQVISFEEFVYAVSEQPISNMDHHWRTQYYQTFQDAINYDFIGKIENFPSDLNHILSRITDDYNRFITTESRHAKGANDLLAEFYTPKLKEIVQEKFAIDFEYFGYKG